MVLISAGEFMMGCDETNPLEFCYSDEMPLHAVYLDAFYIDKYEVTNAEYRACVADGACPLPRSLRSRTRGGYFTSPLWDDYPVIEVSWFNATTYCAWAGKRLPSEAEWEKAARGSQDTRLFPWGNWPANCDLANRIDCVGDTTWVHRYPNGASPYGVLQMTGNIIEWVNDWFQADYYAVSPYLNPPGPVTGTYKVMRGGSWDVAGRWSRVAYRERHYPSSRENYYGIRCAADPPGG